WLHGALTAIPDWVATDPHKQFLRPLLAPAEPAELASALASADAGWLRGQGRVAAGLLVSDAAGSPLVLDPLVGAAAPETVTAVVDAMDAAAVHGCLLRAAAVLSRCGGSTPAAASAVADLPPADWETAFVTAGRTMSAFAHVVSRLVDRVRILAREPGGPSEVDEIGPLCTALLGQIQWFADRVAVLDIMELCHVPLAEAEAALTFASDNASVAIDALRAGNVTTGAVDDQNSSPFKKALINEMRASLYTRLRLLLCLIPTIIQSPTALHLVPFVQSLVKLLTARIVHGDGTQEPLFEFALDLTGWLMDEVPKANDFNRVLLGCMRDIQPLLVIPKHCASRINRILPFQVHNMYTSTLLAVGSSGAASAPSTALRADLLQPWEWLEDGAGGGGGDEELNDTPISLALFGAAKVPRGGMTFRRMFDAGWMPGVEDVEGPEEVKAGVGGDVKGEWKADGDGEEEEEGEMGTKIKMEFEMEPEPRGLKRKANGDDEGDRLDRSVREKT
ncbi:hypothetical protein BDK51DRAFT_32802, partial [Blyttiomyces helicus]